MTATLSASLARYILRLSDLTRDDRLRAGVKAANLGALSKAGFPVPDGFVLTAEAFRQFLAANAVASASTPAEVAAAALPSDVAEALAVAATALGDVPLAVRSSGIAEDLPGASFAGQYESVLDVRGPEALAAAVRQCWASAFTRRVSAYRATQGQGDVSGMAVLVQRLVPADAGGVAFTANPISGNREEVVVSAVRGLGERLVAGQVSPDEWLVRRDEAVCQRPVERAIDAAQARAVADLARRVEAYFGVPQDIEWAIADDELFLLQARPITTLAEPPPSPIPVPAEPPDGYWLREASHFPQPLSPMCRSIILAPESTDAFRRVNAEFGLLVERLDVREIGGWVYQRLVPLGGKDRPAPPSWLVPLLIRLVPSMRSRIKQCAEAVRTDVAGRYVEQWYAEWKSRLTSRIAELRAVDVATLPDDALDEHLATLWSFVGECADVHVRLHGGLSLVLGELAFACRDLLGWDDRQTLELLGGLSEKSSEPARRLAALASIVRERPPLRKLLEHIDSSTVARLPEVDPDFAAAFAAYQHEFGCRAIRYEVADPTVAESPELVLGLIRDQVLRGYDPASDASALAERRAAAVARARQMLANRPSKDRDRFERALSRAERAYPVREDNEFYTVSAPLALVRDAALELGRRLALRGAIAQRDDVFFLELAEVREALRQPGDRRALVAQRKAERAWVEANPGPTSYGKPPGPPPSFAGLPPEARFAHEALLWTNDRIFSPQSSQSAQSSATLAGVAASSGQYTGPVRVIMTEGEFGKLQPGDVLVCPITSPVWSVLFPSIGALVTDTGGVLSHPAIIAREYRVPAVVATGNATRLLRDGQIVTVDGSVGTVKIG